jgi:hypothetical protein
VSLSLEQNLPKSLTKILPLPKTFCIQTTHAEELINFDFAY